MIQILVFISMATTRASSKTSVSEFIGNPENFLPGDLPTYRSVLQQMLQLQLDDPRDKRNIPIHELSVKTADLLLDTWRFANSKISETPVIISTQQIIHRMK